MAEFRSGVIGIGGIGKQHGKMHRDTGALDVVAFCDANPAWGSWVEQEFPEAKFYTSTEELFKAESLDLVTIAVPHNLHAPIAIQALEAGANVVVEKPMATTYADAQAMMAAARRTGRFLTVFHNRRLDPWFLAARSAIQDGLLGNVIELNTGINYGPGPRTWRGYKQASGGLQFDWGAHLVDYSLNLIDSPVKHVSGYSYCAPDTPADRCEDHVVTRIHFASGAIANVTSSGRSRHQPDRFRIVGEQGTLIDKWDWAEDGKAEVHTRLSGGEMATTQVAYRKPKPEAYYDNVVAHLRDGTPLLVEDASAAKVINVLCTAERSANEGGVPLPLA
ncbi:MAG: Gfo/Idh/MocA family oxidoreductase [Phycisphaeraceae bacterium]